MKTIDIIHDEHRALASVLQGLRFIVDGIRDGKMQSSRFNAQQVTLVPQNVKQIASANMHYLNEQKTLAILNIEYK